MSVALVWAPAACFNPMGGDSASAAATGTETTGANSSTTQGTGSTTAPTTSGGSTGASTTGSSMTTAATTTGATTGETSGQTTLDTTGLTEITVTTGLTITGATLETLGTSGPDTTGVESTTTTTTNGTTQPPPPVCGDGNVDPGEQCDDGNAIDEDGCDNGCNAEFLVVFLSSTTLTGAELAADKGDIACNQLAAKEPALAGRSFVAWVSYGVDDPIGPKLGQSALPYRLVNGLKVADNTADLLDNSLDNPISFNEMGQVVKMQSGCDQGTEAVWTGSNADGTAALDNCAKWTLDAGLGRVGAMTAIDNTWSFCASRPCSLPFRIYCIEKAPG